MKRNGKLEPVLVAAFYAVFFCAMYASAFYYLESRELAGRVSSLKTEVAKSNKLFEIVNEACGWFEHEAEILLHQRDEARRNCDYCAGEKLRLALEVEETKQRLADFADGQECERRECREEIARWKSAVSDEIDCNLALGKENARLRSRLNDCRYQNCFCQPRYRKRRGM